MTVTAPALYWYQLDVGTLAPNYYSQLNLAVAQLCAVNSVTAPTAPWYNPISGTLVNDWHLQIDTAVRALSTALSVTPPSGSVINLTPGTETANYYASLDACVRLLCAASASGTAPTITSDGGGPTATVNVTTGDTAVTTVTATGTATVTFSISGGADAALFTINSTSGVLTFMSASVDGNYAVIVRATNLFGTDDQAITAAVSSSSYHADAVHFDGTADIHIASLTAAGDNTGYFSVVGWAKFSLAQFTGNPLFVGDSADAYNGMNTSSVAAPPQNSFIASVGTSGGANFLGFTGTDAVPVDTWHCIMISIQSNFSAGNKIFQFYIDDAAYAGTKNDNSGAFTPTFNGKDFYFFNDSFGDFLAGDAADWRIMPGVFLDFSDISTRRLFIDANGKPVDPATATASLGTPCILFSGDSTAFPINQGTGGAFTLTGSLTNASTSPSD